MARRRIDDGSFDYDGTRQEQGLGGFPEEEAPFTGGPVDPGGFTAPPSTGTPRPGSLDPDMDNALRGVLAADGGDIAGNTDSARDLRPSMPNTVGSQPAPFALPQGVSVNESAAPAYTPPAAPDYTQAAPAYTPPAASMFSAMQPAATEPMGGGDYTQDAPAAPMEPSPAAALPANPQQTFQGTPPASPTARRVSAAPSALFGEEGSSSMFGRAGGLLGGGKGVLGAGSDGEIEPSEMLKKLLEMYGQS